MSKRFTDSGKWDDPWFCELSNEYKLLWFYLLDKCNHAGIFKVNLKNANFSLNSNFALNEILENFKDRVVILSKEKWFIPKFIEFQYGELDNNNRVHASINRILTKEGVLTGLNSPLDRGKDMDMVKDKVNKGVVKGIFNFDIVYNNYPKKIGKKEALIHFNASVKTDQDWVDINKAVDNYNAYIQSKGVEEKYIKHASTFFNNWKDWVVMPVSGEIIPDSLKKYMRKDK